MYNWYNFHIYLNSYQFIIYGKYVLFCVIAIIRSHFIETSFTRVVTRLLIRWLPLSLYHASDFPDIWCLDIAASMFLSIPPPTLLRQKGVGLKFIKGMTYNSHDAEIAWRRPLAKLVQCPCRPTFQMTTFQPNKDQW